MKHLINATTLAFGLICVSGICTAQDATQAQTTNMRDVTVDAAPAQYETYMAHLDAGYTLHALVGNTHRQFVQAQRTANSSESLRQHGIDAPIAVAIDNASGPGMARQVQLIDPARNIVGIVNVYCKRAMPAGAARCTLDPLPMPAHDQRLASTPAEYLQVAEVERRD